MIAVQEAVEGHSASSVADYEEADHRVEGEDEAEPRPAAAAEVGVGGSTEQPQQVLDGEEQDRSPLGRRKEGALRRRRRRAVALVLRQRLEDGEADREKDDAKDDSQRRAAREGGVDGGVERRRRVERCRVGRRRTRVLGAPLDELLEGGADEADRDAEEPRRDDRHEGGEELAGGRVVAERRFARQVEQREPHRVGDGLVAAGHLRV
mmetsp:Transcript_31057/g.103799  ORF Transcript_31057/g.103799 Transcript_31057/m.103799 type:complete len:208 (-) Transcript_31057:1317-1940(-)